MKEAAGGRLFRKDHLSSLAEVQHSDLVESWQVSCIGTVQAKMAVLDNLMNNDCSFNNRLALHELCTQLDD